MDSWQYRAGRAARAAGKAAQSSISAFFFLAAVLPLGLTTANAADRKPPAVTITAPVSGATVFGTITVTASASDNRGVAGVQFKYNGVNLGAEDTTAPYSVSADTTTVPNGSYALTAVARDAAGSRTTSAPVTVTVANAPPPDTTSPTVGLTSPGTGATVFGTITMTASASDNVGVVGVQFKYNGINLGAEDATAPYSVSVDTTTLSNGSHILTAVARDAAGNLATSAPVTVTVSNAPPPDTTPPTVGISSPAPGSIVGGTIIVAASASDNVGVGGVQFKYNGINLGAEDTTAPYSVSADTTTVPNGSYTLTAVARDAAGNLATSALVTISVSNGPPPDTTPPTVGITAPGSGATVSGTITVTASAVDNVGVAGVQFKYDDINLGAEITTAPFSVAVNTTTAPNGSHILTAVARDAAGNLATSTPVSITVSNDTTPPLPTQGAKATATFESLGLYWTPPSNPGAAGCTVRYRKTGESAWKDGLAMWYDARNTECRGSLVHLSPGTSYEVRFAMPGQSPVAQITANTWSETFPIAQTVYLANGTITQTLTITQGGSPAGYVLYTSPPGGQTTIDVANAQLNNITISAPYVIVRGLTMRGAQEHGIVLLDGAHDVVIENNDISGWGRYSYTNSVGWQIGADWADGAAGVFGNCSATPGQGLERVVIQRNRIHHPRYGANSWDWGHPSGPQAIGLIDCGGNSVFRYNEIYSDGTDQRRFNDGMGGAYNFSSAGFPGADSDIYGNIVMHAWEDGIEVEGGGRNVRVWGNYLDRTTTGVSSTATQLGPLYIFRNVYNRARTMSQVPLDQDIRSTFAKSGTSGGWGGGRRYIFHNTLLQAPPPPGSVFPLGAGRGINMTITNTVSRNNVFHVWQNFVPSIEVEGGTGNDFDYDLYNGVLSGTIGGAESNGIAGAPVYAAGNGWSSESGGLYSLAAGSPGHDQGVRIPNFNDGLLGAGPDVGAHEAGSPAMSFGVNAVSTSW